MFSWSMGISKHRDSTATFARTSGPGLIELLTATRSKVSAFERVLSRDEVLDNVFLPMNINDYLVHTNIPKLKLLKAGAFNESCSARINTFDWEGLYRSQPFFFAGLADYRKGVAASCAAMPTTH